MNHPIFQWAIVGAGPAGIAAVGQLLDSGIHPSQILWIDPKFNVGDLGTLWRNVSSNTSVKLFNRFLNEVKAFSYQRAPIDFQLNHLPPEDTCVLNAVVEPLQWVSDQLSQIVTTQKAMINHINLSERVWSLHAETTTYHAKNVILATGAEPETLNYPNVETLPLTLAIDKERLSQSIVPNQTYAVFGSSHSAIMILKHLVDLDVKKIIHFYRSPCRYAIDMGDWILFDNTGLKGKTAQWAREFIDGALPSR